MFQPDARHYDAPLDPQNPRDSRSVAVKLIGTDKRVLELGPATGRITRALKENNCQVVAIERDARAAEMLRSFCTVIEGDIEQLPLEHYLKGMTFDVILAGDFLEHLQDPVQVLQELRPFLGPNGFVVSSIPNVTHGSVRLELLQENLNIAIPGCWTAHTFDSLRCNPSGRCLPKRDTKSSWCSASHRILSSSP